ncbi:hypothetical protein ACOSQ3_009878 [Xanthoceras sorbifolium]
MSRKSQEEVTTEYWSKLSSQSSPSMKKDTNKEGPHNKEENEVEDLVEEWLLHQNTEIRSRWRIHCRCFPGISQLKGRIEQSLTWPEALTSNHTIPPTTGIRAMVEILTTEQKLMFSQVRFRKIRGDVPDEKDHADPDKEPECYDEAGQGILRASGSL